MDNFLPGSASLVDCVDKRILVILRDGKKLLGWLRSYDQFANLVLQDSVERTILNDTYGDVYRGMFVVRGENVVLLGEIDDEREEMVTSTLLREVPASDIIAQAKADSEQKRRREVLRGKVLHDQGFVVDVVDAHDHY